MSIYTANGDKGTTNLVHTKNVSKSDDRIQLVGTIDELSSHLGLIKTMMSKADDIRFIENIQRTLNAVCSGVADPFNREFRTEDDRTGQLEEEISRLEGLFHCPEEENILPGSSRLSAELDIARAVARRAERDLAAVSVKFGADNGAKKYMNRLSDYLYVMARYMETTEQPVQKKEEITPFGGKEAEPVAAVQTPMTDEAVIQEVLKRMGIQGRITLDGAKRLIDKIEQEAKRRGKNAVIAVCGPDGNPIAVHVMDGAFTWLPRKPTLQSQSRCPQRNWQSWHSRAEPFSVWIRWTMARLLSLAAVYLSKSVIRSSAVWESAEEPVKKITVWQNMVCPF